MKNDILLKIQNKLNNSNINLDTNVSDAGIDSLDLMSYIFELEEEYEIQLDEDQLSSINNFGDLVDAIESKINNGQ